PFMPTGSFPPPPKPLPDLRRAVRTPRLDHVKGGGSPPVGRQFPSGTALKDREGVRLQGRGGPEAVLGERRAENEGPGVVHVARPGPENTQRCLPLVSCRAKGPMNRKVIGISARPPRSRVAWGSPGVGSRSGPYPGAPPRYP